MSRPLIDVLFPPTVAEFTATLPYPPSLNTYWRNLKSGRVLISATGRGYRTLIQNHVAFARITGRLDGPLKATLRLAPPDRRRRDLDNTFKALFDALKHAGVYEDDSQIKHLDAAFLDPVKGGSVLVWLQPWDGMEGEDGRSADVSDPDERVGAVGDGTQPGPVGPGPVAAGQGGSTGAPRRRRRQSGTEHHGPSGSE